MALFKSPTHQQVWIEHHCGRCFFGRGEEQCSILTWALGHGRKPVEWERNTRKNLLMAETIKCHKETRTAPSIVRPVVNEDVAMFDVTPTTAMDSEHQ